MFLYRIFSILALLAYSPYALLRRLTGSRRLGDLRGRLGRAPYPNLSGGIWIHAVSVGEVGVARNLLSALARRSPGCRVGLSVTTVAGRELAQRLVGGEVPVFAFPLDLSGPVEKALDGARPGLVLLTETEIWPLFLEQAASRSIPVALVNGRVSIRSYRRYRLVRAWLRETLGRVALFAMQSTADAERILSLGAEPARVRVTGNLKYDMPEAPPFADSARLTAAANGRPIFVAGSTAEGEEQLVLGAWKSLDPRPFLVLAPRRPERFDEVAALIERSGFVALRRSRPFDSRLPTPDGIYLLDSIGELASLYREARLALVGGSFAPLGGHNPIEAWAAGVPVVLGPHTENFRQIAEEGEARGLARRAAGERELARELGRALSSPTELRERGERARRFVNESRGAADRTAELLLPLLHAEQRRKAAP